MMTHISQKSKLRECVATHFLSGDNRTQPSSLDLQLQTGGVQQGSEWRSCRVLILVMSPWDTDASLCQTTCFKFTYQRDRVFAQVMNWIILIELPAASLRTLPTLQGFMWNVSARHRGMIIDTCGRATTALKQKSQPLTSDLRPVARERTPPSDQWPVGIWSLVLVTSAAPVSAVRLGTLNVIIRKEKSWK